MRTPEAWTGRPELQTGFVAPTWLRNRLNDFAPAEVAAFMQRRGGGKKLHSGSHALDCTRHLVPSPCVGLFDHYGKDLHNNLVTEPYGRECDGCLAALLAVSEKLQLSFLISDETWWAPHLKQCIRVTLWPCEDGVLPVGAQTFRATGSAPFPRMEDGPWPWPHGGTRPGDKFKPCPESPPFGDIESL
jgi:hypothetical protein